MSGTGNWTYSQVKTADAALDPPQSDPNAAAAVLNAQIAPLAVPVNTSVVVSLLLFAPTEDLLRVQVRAAQPLSEGWPGSPASTDEAIATAKLAVALLGTSPSFLGGAPQITVEQFSTFVAWLGVLQTAGDVSEANVATITALGTIITSIWQPLLTGSDVATARFLG